MKSKFVVVLGVLMALALLVGLARAAQAEPNVSNAPDSPPEYSTQDLWVSGWVDINPDQTLVFNHNLGGDINTYVVELTFRDENGTLGIHRRNYGGLEYSGSWFGAHWQNLTTTSIEVYRQPDDIGIDQVRLAIWTRTDPVDFDSGWVNINPGTTVTITHSLGITATDLGVSLWFSDTVRGIHHYAYGGLFQAAPPELYGSYWHNLTENTIRITRAGDDMNTEQFRVAIVESDPPTYDSLVALGGWQAIDQGTVFTFVHNLNTDPNLLIVRSECYDPTVDGYGIHQVFAGGNHDGFTGWQGANLQNLTENSVDVARRQNDLVCPQARVRVWAPVSNPITYLPTIIRNYVRTQTLAYDDGTAESDQSHDIDSGFAVLFNTPGTSAYLLGARYYLNTAAGTFPIEVHVWDAAHNDLLIPFMITPPAGQAWFDVDLTAYNLTVSGDFYVGFLYPQASFDPSIGVDETAPAGHSYEVPWMAITNNYMIRAVIEPIP